MKNTKRKQRTLHKWNVLRFSHSHTVTVVKQFETWNEEHAKTDTDISSNNMFGIALRVCIWFQSEYIELCNGNFVYSMKETGGKIHVGNGNGKSHFNVSFRRKLTAQTHADEQHGLMHHTSTEKKSNSALQKIFERSVFCFIRNTKRKSHTTPNMYRTK